MPKAFYQIAKHEKYAIRNKANKKLEKDLEQHNVLGIKTLHIILGHKKQK